MIVLVCGGRDYNGDVSCLSQLPMTMLVHGGARGADTLADQWAKSNNIHRARVDALWDTRGKAAGMDRNAAMLLLRPDYCVAFPGGRGTEGMVSLCLSRNIPVWRPYA